MINAGSKVLYSGPSAKNAKMLKGIIGEVTSKGPGNRVNATFVTYDKENEKHEHHLFLESSKLKLAYRA